MKNLIFIIVLVLGSFLFSSCGHSPEDAYTIQVNSDGLVTVEAYQEVTIKIKKNDKVEDLHLYPGNTLSYEDADVQINPGYQCYVDAE